MSTFRNENSVQNQVGHQVVHGNIIFNDRGSTSQRALSNDGGDDSEKQIDNDILASLAFPYMLTRKGNIERAHRQTCQWLFTTGEYKSWKARSGGLLWIKGVPGSGKSTLMSHLYNALWDERNLDTDIHLEFFFSARGAPLQRSPLGMLRSLLSQIFHQDSGSRFLLRGLYQKKKASFGNAKFHCQWHLAELREIFINMVSASAKHHRIIVFIDALDEAGQDAAQATAHYFHTLHDCLLSRPVKICISCRHYPVPSTARALEVHVEQHNHQDIRAYVEDYIRLDDLSPELMRRRKEWLGLSGRLVEAARGVFQWVCLVLPMVGHWMSDGYSLEEIQRQLTLVPRGLEEVYRHIVVHVVNDHHRTNCLWLFQWVCFARRPLSVTEMRYALAAMDLNADSRTLSSKRRGSAELIAADTLMASRIRAWSGGLIETARNARETNFVVQVIHQSVKDFFSKEGLILLSDLERRARHCDQRGQLEADISRSIQTSHSTLYFSCLRYMAAESADGPDVEEHFADGRLLARRSAEKTAQGETVNPRWPFLNYAAVYYLAHARKAGSRRSLDLDDESRLLTQILLTRKLTVGTTWDFSTWPPSQPLYGTTVLQMAAAAGLDDLARYRIEHHDDVESSNDRQWNALHLSADQGHVSITQALLDAGVNATRPNSDKQTPMLLAARRGNTEVFSALLHRGISVNSRDDRSRTPLYIASEYSQLEICKICIDAGAHVDARDETGRTILQSAVFRGDVKITQLLLKAGANVNARGSPYDTALEAAVQGGKEEILRIILEAGANINASDGRLGTVLHGAVHQGNEKMVQMLLEAGADANARGPQGETAVYDAVAGLNSNLKILQLLLKAGADVNIRRNGDRCSALHMAVCVGNDEAARLLLAAGADRDVGPGRLKPVASTRPYLTMQHLRVARK